MGLIKGFLMSIGMFTVIPVPAGSWDEKHMPLVIACLPPAGLCVGVIWYLLSFLLLRLQTPVMLLTAAVALIPLALSGFIHADGYMDTADAVLSRRDLEEKKRILKDPHVGAFAVIMIAALFLLQFGAAHACVESGKSLCAFAFIPAAVRCVAGVFTLNAKQAFEKGYGASFKSGTKPRHTVFVCAFAAVLSAVAWTVAGFASLAPILAGMAGCAVVSFYLYKQFKGMSGDLCGCAITIGEFCALLCMALI